MSWSSLMIDRLLISKSEDLRLGRGLNFDRAWALAMRRYPPAGGVGEPTSLFDERGEAHDPVVEFLKRVSREAYLDTVGPAGKGNGPSMRFFRAEMLRDVDSSTPARRSTLSAGRMRQAA